MKIITILLRILLVFSFLSMIYFNSRYFNYTTLIFLVCLHGMHYIDLIRFKNVLKDRELIFNLKQIDKPSFRDNVKWIVYQLIVMAVIILLASASDNFFEGFDFLVLLMAVAINFLESHNLSKIRGYYHIFEEYALTQSPEYKMVSWDSIKSITEGDKAGELIMTLKDDKFIYFRVEETDDFSVQDIIEFIERKIQNAVQYPL